MATLREGGCPCGAVRFRTRGDPQDWIRCDCGFCRGLTRTRGPGEPVWPNASVEFAGGTIGSVDHRSDEHPRPLTVHFCTACGAAVSLSLDVNNLTNAPQSAYRGVPDRMQFKLFAGTSVTAGLNGRF